MFLSLFLNKKLWWQFKRLEGGWIFHLTKGLWFSLRPKWSIPKIHSSMCRTWILVLSETAHSGSSSESTDHFTMWDPIKWHCYLVGASLKGGRNAWTRDSINQHGERVMCFKCYAEGVRQAKFSANIELRKNFRIIPILLDIAMHLIHKQKQVWIPQR